MADARTQIIISARDETQAAIRSAQASLTQLNTQLRGLGETGKHLVEALALVEIGRGIVEFARGAIEAAAALNEMAQQTGLTVEQFGGLKFAAEQSQSNVEALEKGLGKLQGKLGEAGIAGERAHGILLALAQRVQATVDPAKQAALAYEVFGERIGRQLLPLLKKGADGIRELEEASKGKVFSDEAAKAANEFEDALKALSGTAQAGFVNALVPVLEELTKILKDPAAIEGAKRLGENIAAVFAAIANNLPLLEKFALALTGAFAARWVLPLVGAIASVSTSIGGAVAAQTALIAASRATALARVQELSPEVTLTGARLASAEAAAAAVAGEARMAIVMAEVIPLQRAAVIQAGLLAEAQAALGAVTITGAAAAVGWRAAIAALFSPIGIITTLLVSGAAAWFLWGDNAKDAVDKADDAIGRAKKAIGDLADQKLVSGAGTSLALNLRELNTELDELEKRQVALEAQFKAEGEGGFFSAGLGRNVEQNRAKIAALKAQIAEVSALVSKAGAEAPTTDQSGLDKLLETPVKGAEIAKAQTAATLGLIKAQTAGSLKELENLYSDHLLTIGAYYAERLKLETTAIDAEIAVSQRAAADSTGAERVRLEGQIAELREKRSATAIESAHAEAVAQRKLNDEFEKTRETLASLQGKPIEAAQIKVSLDQRDIRAQIQEILNDPGAALDLKIKAKVTLEGLDKISQLTVASAGLTDLERQITDINTRAGESERTLQLNIESGLETTLSAGEKTIAVHHETADALDALLPKYIAVNEAIGTPEALNRIEALKNRILELRVPVTILGTEIKGALTSSFGSFFSDLISGAKSVGDAFRDLEKNILNSFANIAAQHLAEQLFSTALSAFGGGGNYAPVVEGAASVLGSYHHQGGIVGEGGVMRPVPALAFIGAPRLHSGGMLALRSDEVPAILQKGEGVVSRADMRDRGGGGAVNVVMNVTTPDAQSFRKARSQIEADLRMAAERGRRNF